MSEKNGRQSEISGSSIFADIPKEKLVELTSIQAFGSGLSGLGRYMLVTLVYKRSFLLLLVSLFLAVAFSCQQADRYVGTYLTQEGELSGYSETCIELKKNGVGVWRVLDDEASFRWDAKDNEIRLHTKSGGVIIGKIQGDTLEIALPGRSVRYFKRVKEKVTL